VLRNVTITLSEEALRWARKRAAEEETSVSRLVGRMLEDEMLRTDQYWTSFKKWKKLKPIAGFDASKRAKRDELYDRR
jgi:hypothetical protein